MKPITFALAFILAGATSSHAIMPVSQASETLTFDDASSESSVGSGYFGLNFQNFFRVSTTDNAFGTTGAPNVIVSTPDGIYNGNAAAATISSSTTFNLDSFYLGSFFEDGITVGVTGYDASNSEIATATYTVDTQTPVLETPGFLNVSSVVFTTTPGTPHAGYSNLGSELILDNLTVSGTAIPEPSTYALMGLAVLAAAGLGGFRKSVRS